MADNSGSGNGTVMLAFLVGCLLVAVIVLFVFHGVPGMGSHPAASSGPSATLTVHGGKS